MDLSGSSMQYIDGYWRVEIKSPGALQPGKTMENTLNNAGVKAGDKLLAWEGVNQRVTNREDT